MIDLSPVSWLCTRLCCKRLALQSQEDVPLAILHYRLASDCQIAMPVPASALPFQPPPASRMESCYFRTSQINWQGRLLTNVGWRPPGDTWLTAGSGCMRPPIESGDTSHETFMLGVDIATAGGVLTQVAPAIGETGSLPARIWPPQVPWLIEGWRFCVQCFDHSAPLFSNEVCLPGRRHTLSDYIIRHGLRSRYGWLDPITCKQTWIASWHFGRVLVSVLPGHCATVACFLGQIELQERDS